MASNLSISYPDIPFNAVTITPAATFSTDLDKYNLVTGPRYQLGEFDAAATANNLVFDLGASYASVQNTANHIIIARADKLQAATMTELRVDWSTNGAAWTNVYDDASFNTATLYGTRSDDYIGTFTLTDAKRYWRIRYDGSSQKFRHSKAYLGKLFTFDYSPDFEFDIIEAGESEWYSSSGAIHLVRPDEPIYRFELTWMFQTDSTIQLFMDRIAKYSELNPVFLYTTAQHQILDSQRLVHCNLVSVEHRKMPGINNKNDLRCVFEEIIG